MPSTTPSGLRRRHRPSPPTAREYPGSGGHGLPWGGGIICCRVAPILLPSASASCFRNGLQLPQRLLGLGLCETPPRLLLLGMTHVLTSLLCPKAQTVIPAALVGLIEILSLPAYTATLVSGTAMARCGRSVAPSGDHALDFSILVAPPALGYALCLSPCPCQESQPGTCPRAAWTATPGSSSPSSTGFTPVPLGQ